MKTRIWLVLAFWALVLTGCGGTTTAPGANSATAINTPATAPSATMAPPTATSAPTTAATIAPTATPTPPATPTATPLPTDTPSPSPTPAPAASVTGDSINVRSGPGTIYPVVGKAAKGESLPVIARNQDGSWLEVELKDGKRGWVATKLMQSSVPTESLPIEAKIPPAPTSQPPPAATTAPKPDYTTATIIGRVMGKDGDPKVSEHIQVTVLGFEKRIETWTGPDGRFAISGVPAGEEYLMGVLIGLETSATNSMLVVVNGDSLFSLQPGATLDLGEIKVSW